MQFGKVPCEGNDSAAYRGCLSIESTIAKSKKTKSLQCTGCVKENYGRRNRSFQSNPAINKNIYDSNVENW